LLAASARPTKAIARHLRDPAQAELVGQLQRPLEFVAVPERRP
jgi:hypothetical protein